MNKKCYIVIILLIVTIVIVTYHFFVSPNSNESISLLHPDIHNWFGTDVNGNDVFLKTIEAFGFEILTLVAVITIVWPFGLVFGSLVSLLQNRVAGEFFMNFIHFAATLPILLVALFLLIVFGAGYINSIIVLSLSIIPTQALFVHNHLESAKNEDFLIAKKSYGMATLTIYRVHLLPYISKRYNNYTLSRLPEIIMMNLALSFLGLGLQEPTPSLGRILFDGLSFMFSAWWLWVFCILFIILIYFFFINTFRYYE
jgi:ABC-type dipeptide/oligopeptide/nickel transport system permease subunit